jgi:hypothetical protein
MSSESCSKPTATGGLVDVVGQQRLTIACFSVKRLPAVNTLQASLLKAVDVQVGCSRLDALVHWTVLMLQHRFSTSFAPVLGGGVGGKNPAQTNTAALLTGNTVAGSAAVGSTPVL